MLAMMLLAAAALADPSAARDSIAAFAHEEMSRSHVPGISVAVVRGDRVAIAIGFGEGNVEWSGPVDDATVFELMSVGKQFTAAAIMRLVENGRWMPRAASIRWTPASEAGERPPARVQVDTKMKVPTTLCEKRRKRRPATLAPLSAPGERPTSSVETAERTLRCRVPWVRRTW